MLRYDGQRIAITILTILDTWISRRSFGGELAMGPPPAECAKEECIWTIAVEALVLHFEVQQDEEIGMSSRG